MTEWPVFTVQQLIERGVIARPMDGNHGAIHPKTGDFVPFGVPFIMASDLKGGQVDFAHCAFIAEGQARSLRKGFTKPGDVLLSHKATIGRTAIVQNNLHPLIVLTPQITYYRVIDKKVLNNKFLKYYFESAYFKDIFEAWAGAGSTRAYLGITNQQRLPILLPPIEIQSKIADIIAPLDDKIDLNRQMNETLEAMARAIFKDWFVDFGPVRAKAEGRQPPGLAPDIAALFPDALDDEDKPMGWQWQVLGDVAQNVLRSCQPNEIEPGTPYIALEHMPRRSIALSEWSVADRVESNKLRFRKGEFLFGKLRPYFHKIGVAPVDGVCTTDAVVVSAKTPAWSAAVLMTLSSDEFVAFTDQGSTGTKMPRTSWREMARYPVICPPTSDLARGLNDLISPMTARIAANITESRTLTTLRDLLLPKLMSGEIRIRDAEKAVDAVA